MGDAEPKAEESAIPKLAPVCLGVVQKLYPDAQHPSIEALAPIWDEVVQRIIDEMTALDLAEDVALHINIREEMVMELVRLQFWLAEKVVEKRIGERKLSEIDAEREREECLGPEGSSAISATAQMAYEHVWSKRMKERWQPKSEKALEKEANPKPAKLAVKAVDKNHFIPRWFIRDNWATNDRIRRWRRSEDGWTPSWAGIGEWGYRHKLYSDPLEAYFSLLEGDAKRPIQMLLETNPLNIPQRGALVGFLIIQVLRNPHTMAAVERALAPIIADLGHSDDPEMARKAYKTLFRNNEFYHAVSHLVMWSPWAIVRSERPLFVLPDTFSARTGISDGMNRCEPNRLTCSPFRSLSFRPCRLSSSAKRLLGVEAEEPLGGSRTAPCPSSIVITSLQRSSPARAPLSPRSSSSIGPHHTSLSTARPQSWAVASSMPSQTCRNGPIED